MAKKQAKCETFTPSARPLPPDFSDKVHELELRLEIHCTIETLTQILELYSQAMEYYEAINDVRFSVYQDRMQNLIMKPDVVRVMKGEKVEPRQKPQPQKETRREPESDDTTHAIRSRRLTRVVEEATIPQERSAQSIFSSMIDKTRSAFSAVKSGIRTQHQSVERRLSDRKRNLSRRRTRNISQTEQSEYFTPKALNHSFQFPSESDVSGGSTPQTQAEKDLETFQNEFEAIMETFVTDKMKISAEIKAEFQAQIEELDKSPESALVNKIKQDLSQEMDKRIHRAVAQLEEDKRKRIDALRYKF